MPTLIAQPTRVEAAGNKPKLIDEYVGRVNSRHDALSVAHMRSPGGWVEPGQAPEFDEFTVVLKGTLRVTHRGGVWTCGPARRWSPTGRVGAVQHAGAGRGGIRRGLPAGVLAADGPPRRD